jgi:class 3 adenylate cyclase
MPVAKLQAFTPTSPMQQMTVKGSVLFADIRRFTAFTEALTGEEIVELLTAFLGEACEPIRQQCGWVVKFLGDGLVAMFEPRPGGGEDHAERALKSALLMVLAARNFSTWLAQRFPGRRLPAFAIGVGVHSGEVMVCNMGGGDGAETTVIGDSVNIASRLEGMTKEYGWSIVASQSCASLAGGRIATGRDGRVVPRGKTQSLDVVEITGLAPRTNSSAAQAGFYEALRSAAVENAAIIDAARALAH